MNNKRFLSPLIFLLTVISGHGQYDNLSVLSIEQIMKGPEFVGHLPGNAYWSPDSKTAYFRWNPENKMLTSLYKVSVQDGKVEKVNAMAEFDLPTRRGEFNKDRTKYLYTSEGDIILLDIASGESRKLMTNREDIESVGFTADEDALIFSLSNNLVKWEIETGSIEQLTNFTDKKERPDRSSESEEDFLSNQQQELFLYFQKQKEREAARKENDLLKPEKKKPRSIPLDNKSIFNIELSPNEKYISFSLFERNSSSDQTEVPKFVTESGYTETSRARSKVGSSFGSIEYFVYHLAKDTVFSISLDELPGINDAPEYKVDYNIPADEDGPRKVRTTNLIWSDNGELGILNIRSLDNKDRWILLLDPETGTTKLLDRQHDEAWIAGPGIDWTFSGGALGWLPDNKNIYFQSEETGYSHLYIMDVSKMKKTQLTKGDYEVYDPQISLDGKTWFFSSNQVHPGERYFYRMPLMGGKVVQLTTMVGNNDVSLSHDEKHMIIRHSYSNKPWELYLQETAENSTPVKITDSYTDDFSAYQWRDPEIIKFKARDDVMVPARLYRPESDKKNGAAVIFVHGAGYLQNVHKWWSSYYREYMFHNFLADNGYTVLDIDYRGSAGYGRDWRTAIYRHMGGQDLEDQVDGAEWLADELDIDPSRIGIYGGSYGGFITLMAMFTQADVFAAGAALRSVTDWAHYNHGYTSNILNTPEEDSIAYRKSSPIYFAEGLEGHLLICHGMIDDNVHFQDVVRLAQRLIELGKDNWEMAVYPVERHTFTEPSSWADEYKRIYKLFDEHLNSE